MLVIMLPQFPSHVWGVSLWGFHLMYGECLFRFPSHVWGVYVRFPSHVWGVWDSLFVCRECMFVRFPSHVWGVYVCEVSFSCVGSQNFILNFHFLMIDKIGIAEQWFCSVLWTEEREKERCIGSEVPFSHVCVCMWFFSFDQDGHAVLLSPLVCADL